MLGWRPYSEIAGYYQESDVGLNIDALHYETIYGTRTRLVEMLAAGLPVITSTGCELSDLIDKQGAGLIFETGNWQGLGQQILTLAGNRELYQNMAETAFDYASHGLSFSATTKPVRAWVKQPQLAPDKKSTNLKEKLQHLEYQARAIVRQAIWRVASLDK
jgi:glycosyltransferase involved in cell wall biosynthesis